MENSFIYLENTPENINLLEFTGFKQVENTIFDNEKPHFILSNKNSKTFWVTCQEGLETAQILVKEKFNQIIQNKCQN